MIVARDKQRRRLRPCVARFVALALMAVIVEPSLAQPVVTTYPAPTSVPPMGTGPTFYARSAQRLGQPVGGFESVPTGDGTIIRGPLVRPGTLGYSTQSGVQLSLAANPASQYGYQPVVVTAKLRRPATSERTVRVRLSMGNYYTAGKSMVADAVLRFAAGDSSVTQTMLVPQYQDWPMCAWEVTVDRRVDDELTVDSGSFLQQSSSFIASGLVISDQTVPADVISTIQATANGGANVRTRKLNEVTDNWLHYSTLDVVVIDVDEFVKLHEQHRRSAEALLRWVRAGGNLWILNAGVNWQKMPEAERVLGLRRPRGADDETPGPEPTERSLTDSADLAVTQAGWTFAPLIDLASDPNEAALTLSGFVRDESPPTPTPRKNATQIQPTEVEGVPRATAADLRTGATTSKAFFVVRALGLGTATAFRRDLRSPFGASSNEVTSMIQQSLLQLRLTHGGRYGNRPDSANAEFNNWLIPGVGVAPVGKFQFLITLFVLAIGPLNYWWLKRQRKLPMLLVTVPVAAATVTLLLLTVGMLGDGISTRTRSRSLTMLDQNAGESATWSRQTYYAGISPRGGLNMPLDAAMYPILSEWSAGRYGQGSTIERRISWGRTQHLERGWLLSRTPTQYLVVNARANKKRLELRPTQQGLRVINRLGTTVTHVVIQDHDGKVYWCEGLAPDQGQVLPEADANEISGKLRKVFTDREPTYPPGADTSWYGNRYYGEQLSTNIMETHFEAIYSPIVERWANGSYIAVTERGIEVDYGVDDVIESDSLHVVCGTW